MAGAARPDGPAPRSRRSKTVWPWVFGALLVITALALIFFALGWIDPDASGDPPGT